MTLGSRCRATTVLVVVGLLFLAACGQQGQHELTDSWYESLKYSSFGRD